MRKLTVAFRQAIALCPRGLDALLRYTSLLAWQGRTEAAVPLVETALHLEPENVALLNLFQQLVVGYPAAREDEEEFRVSAATRSFGIS